MELDQMKTHVRREAFFTEKLGDDDSQGDEVIDPFDETAFFVQGGHGVRLGIFGSVSWL